jgi:hypothetical protein
METIADHCQPNSECNAESPQKPERRYFISKENARALREKSIEVQKRNKAAMEQRLQMAESQALIAQPLIAAAVARTVQDSNSYVSERLIRTRKHLEKLDRELEAADDPRAIKAISDAIARLAEVERILDNRPLPGSHSPTRRQSHPTITIAEPL